MVRFLLDGIEVSNPTNWQSLSSKLKRGDDINTILLTVEGRFDFTDDGYEYLKGFVDRSDFCAEILVSIQQKCGDDYIELFKGKILISDTVVNERTCTINVEIIDRSYFALIDNNKNIKTGITSGISKNNIEFTPPVDYIVGFTLVANGVQGFVWRNVPCIRIDEAFKSIIQYMTDGTVPYTSDTFGIGGDWEGLSITTGKRTRLGTISDFTQFSFKQLFDEVNKRIPLVLIIENPQTSPLIRIEERGYENSNSEIIEVDDIYEITSKFDIQKLYSKIRMGCPAAPVGFIQDTISYFTHKIEEFGFLGQCNIDTELDLECEWSVSTSLITESLNALNQNYDDTIIMVDTDLTTAFAGTTKSSNYLNITGIAKWWYNERLTNKNISERYFGSLANGFASYFGPPGQGLFKSFNGALATVVGYAINNNFNFTNVAFNTGAYFNSTDTFVALEAGIFDFNVFFDINVVSSARIITMYLNVFDNLGNQLGLIKIFPPNTSGGQFFPIGTSTFTATGQAVLAQGSYVTIAVIFGGGGTVEINTSSFWECYQNTVAGGVFQQIDGSDIAIKNYTFDYPLSYNNWQTIINNLTGKVVFSMQGQAKRKGYIKELTYNHITSMAKVTLVTDKNTENAS